MQNNHISMCRNFFIDFNLWEILNNLNNLACSIVLMQLHQNLFNKIMVETNGMVLGIDKIAIHWIKLELFYPFWPLRQTFLKLRVDLAVLIVYHFVLLI